MSIRDYNLLLLNLRNDQIDQINLIKDLAVRNDVWNFYNLNKVKNLTFTTTRPSNSITKDMIQKYYSLLVIYKSNKKWYNKVSKRIDIIVYQEFK